MSLKMDRFCCPTLCAYWIVSVNIAVCEWFAVYCKTHFFCVPFISWISRAWQVRENNGPQKFEYSSISV